MFPTTNKQRVVLINVFSGVPNSSINFLPIPPMGMCILARFLRDRGFEVVVEDFNVLFHTVGRCSYLNWRLPSIDDIVDGRMTGDKNESSLIDVKMAIDARLDQIALSGSDIVGISCTHNEPGEFVSYSAAHIVWLTSNLWERGVKLIVMGGRNCFDGTDTLSTLVRSKVDHYVLNRGERVMEKIIAEWQERHCTSLPKVLRGPGFSDFDPILPCYDGLDLSSYELHLDRLGEEKYHLSSMDRELLINPKQAAIPALFMSGCVNRCAFCVRSASNRRTQQVGVKQVADFLEHIYLNEGHDVFMFFNSQINPTNSYAENLADSIIDRQLPIYWSDSASLRNLTPELLIKLRRAGAQALWFGVECPSDRMLSYIGKNLTVREAEKGIRMAHEAGIWVGVDLIVAMPWEQAEDVELTKSFIERNRPFVDSYALNNFKLKGGLFGEFPEKYKIRVRSGDRSQYDEIGGRTWEERQKYDCFSYDTAHKTIALYYPNNDLVNVPQIPLLLMRQAHGDKRTARRLLGSEAAKKYTKIDCRLWES